MNLFFSCTKPGEKHWKKRKQKKKPITPEQNSYVCVRNYRIEKVTVNRIFNSELRADIAVVDVV